MPPKEHYLAKYFEKPKEKANKSNVFSICKFCIKGLGYDVAVVQSKITHKSRDCKNYLKSCQFFLAEYSYEEQQEILNPPDEIVESSSTNKLRTNHLNEALTRQEKKIHETNVATQAQNTNLEVSDNESFDLSEKDTYEDTYKDIYAEDTYVKDTHVEDTHVEDTHVEDTHVEDTYVENTHIENIYVEELNKSNSGDIQNVNNWRHLVSKWIKLADEEEINEL
ncbi:20788_t:CDS:2, partial [Dentiscutata erythropus]